MNTQSPSIKANIVASYASQIYVTLLGFLLVPIYLKKMGPEAYGLVGFFTMLQAWFQLLDMGLTPTMARETARFQGGAIDALSLRRLLRLLEAVFLGTAITGCALMILGSRWIATRWLQAQHLSPTMVRTCIIIMAWIIALRWISGLYRGLISGLERLVWMGAFNIILATLRFILVIPILTYVGSAPVYFFRYQLFVAVFEFVCLSYAAYRMIPKIDLKCHRPWEWDSILSVLRFSMGIALTGCIWVLVTQVDKLVLSKVLPLAEYAYYGIAVLLANGVTLLSAPVSTALLPRLTKLQAERDEAGVIRLYRNGTQLITLIAAPIAVMFALFGRQILLVWTNNPIMAEHAVRVLGLYGIGNGILAVAAFPYYLQYAKGDIKLHVIGNVIFVVLLIPSVIWATIHFGVTGAGWAWMLANLLNLILWVPLVHKKFIPGLHFQWLSKDIFSSGCAILLAGMASKIICPWPASRLEVLLELCAIWVLILCTGAACSSWARQGLKGLFLKFASASPN